MKDGELPLMRLKPETPVRAQAHVMTVSEFTQRIRGILEPAFTQVWIQGEVSNYKPAASGHVYFSLKDETASISVAAFAWGNRKKNFELKDGLAVLCRGKLSIYPPRGNYQLVVDQIEPLGLGALQIAFEQLKTKLATEGLFRAELKRPLPQFPQKIIVITSPSGAVIQDILNILRRRAPHIQVLVVPALVQGSEAPAQLIRALEIANQGNLGDLIVLARGGGSMEDLWAFNHEALARAIRQSRLPLISAVGHEVDFTIADFVADFRAPTPSAAAEILSAHWVQVGHSLEGLALRIRQLTLRDLFNRRNILNHIRARVVNPKDRLREQAQKVDDMMSRFDRALQGLFERKKSSFRRMVSELEALSPLRVLERGYAMVRDPQQNGFIVKSIKQLKSNQELLIRFYDGETTVHTP